MRTVILEMAIRVLMPVFFIYSVYLFFRGHDNPGGGFIAALVTSIGLIFHMIAFGVDKTREAYSINTVKLMGIGLFCSLTGSLLSVFAEQTFFEALWLSSPLPLIGKVGTPILFDAGVYLLVVGVMLRIAFTIFEE